MLFEYIKPLQPLHFFDLKGEVRKNKLKPLPDTSDFLAESRFAEVEMAWKETGLLFEIEVKKPFEEALYPDFEKGDGVELFINTRWTEEGGASRFCHRFLFLPKAVQGVLAQEITKLPSEETRSLCDPQDLSVKTTFRTKSYTMQIEIPSNSLHGYDPQNKKELGFTYSIYRYRGPAQHLTPVGSRGVCLELG